MTTDDSQLVELEAAVHARPMAGEAWARLGAAYRRMGQTELATEALRRASVLDGSLPWAWLELSFALEQSGEPAESVQAARKAVALAPSSRSARMALATRLIGAGRPREAVLHLSEEVRRAPDHVDALGSLGIAQYHARDFAAAAESLEAALRMDPDPQRPTAWAYLGVSLDETGRHEEAVRALETAVFAEPANGWAWARLGKALRAAGRHREAVEAYDKAVSRDFARPAVWADMGDSAAEIRDLDALERACQALRPLDARVAGKLTRRLERLKTSRRPRAQRRSSASIVSGPCRAANCVQGIGGEEACQEGGKEP